MRTSSRPYVHNERGPGKGGRGTPVTCFSHVGEGGGGCDWTTSGPGKFNDLAFLPVLRTHWVLGSAALPSFFTPVLVEA